MQICNRHAPIKESRVKNRQNPWITSEIIKTMYRRDYLHRKASQTSDSDLINEYRMLRNKVIFTISTEKKKYYEGIHEKINQNPKHFWKEINRVTGNAKNHFSIPKSLNIRPLLQ